MTKHFAFTTLLILICSAGYSQRYKAVVVDNANLPIPGALIVSSGRVTTSSTTGAFVINGARRGDSVYVSFMGYRPHSYVIKNTTLIDTVKLKASSMVLNEVVINGRRNYGADSLRNRRDFAKAFNYKGLALKDAFITVDTSKYIPYDQLTALNNTTAIAKINLLSVLGYFNRNKVNMTRLQKTLLREEDNNYVDRYFTKERVVNLTSLRGDSLETFISRYRPSAEAVKRMTAYEINVYIKNSYADFLKNGAHFTDPPFIKNQAN